MAGQKMLKFVDVDRDMPEKRPPNLRKQDFGEIYAEYASAKAEEQASRCSQCGVPYCQSHCPLHNNIPDWLRLTAEGRLKEAYQVSQATNTFPEICGRICPQDRLCEGNCVIISFEAIRGKHDAVLIATGVYKVRDLEAPGSDADGIVHAIDYLTASNRKSFGDTVPEFESGELNAEGKRIVVI